MDTAAQMLRSLPSMEVSNVTGFTPVATNIYQLPKTLLKKRTDEELCTCWSRNENCTDRTCENREGSTECGGNCRSTNCQNRPITLQQNPRVDLKQFGTKKGCGLVALEAIKKGGFIYELCGEIIRNKEVVRRKKMYQKEGQRHSYFCQVDDDLCIDMSVMGNWARYINHSCEPNAVCERWSVPGTPGCIERVAVYALRPILAGEEISYCYDWKSENGDPCLCQTPKCSGVLGQKAKPPAKRLEVRRPQNATMNHSAKRIRLDIEEEQITISKKGSKNRVGQASAKNSAKN